MAPREPSPRSLPGPPAQAHPPPRSAAGARSLVALLLLAAVGTGVASCRFGYAEAPWDGSGPDGAPSDGDGDGDADDGPDGDADSDADADAEPDAEADRDGDPDDGGSPTFCPPSRRYCDGRLLRTCDDEGSGPVPGADVPCAFTCVEGACVFASNLPPTSYEACSTRSPALEPPPGATVSIAHGGPGLAILCTPHCGDGATVRIDADDAVSQGGGAPDLALFCLSDLRIPEGTTLAVERGLLEAVALFVSGDAAIEGAIDLSGGDASPGARGEAGAGGGAGGRPASGPGETGGGLCGGAGGESLGSGAERVGGGGGGGGRGGQGGAGGSGLSASGGLFAPAGAGGGPCGDGALEPLVGGSGGGAGGGGACSGSCGGAGGGGGGALQVSARLSITVGPAATIDASGGAGYGETLPAVSGGGGGAGGGILLESLVVTVLGGLVADGGGGGASAAGPGGAGATGDEDDGGLGASAAAAARGGAGGGGAAGRIRLGSALGGTACGPRASPASACTSGTLRAAPP